MAKVIKGGGFMAGYTPKISDEPSVVAIYKGCSIHAYTDKYGRAKLVMASKGGSVRNGTNEAYRMRELSTMRETYELEYIMTVGEVK